MAQTFCEPIPETVNCNQISHRLTSAIEGGVSWKALILLAVMMGLAGSVQAEIPGPLFTPSPGFRATNRYVSTTVFHWYTPAAGQVSGPWRPYEGRSNWTGQPEWWKGQIKQMMSANIDVIYVHLIASMEAQRRNLFTALNQLRAEGYDTPKVAPFLDPLIIWNQQPLVDLATAQGKDEFVSHYIRFFEQYFAANSDDSADDYLARQDEKPILNTWHVKFSVTNLTSLVRDDVTARFAAAFAAEHPWFTNGLVMVTTALNPPTLSFADEKMPQFEVNDYYVPATFNSIHAVQLKGGYWDQNIRTPGDFLPRSGGVPYRNAWNQVDRNLTRRVHIESWNEYDEGTGIYAVTNLPPYVAPANQSGNTDVWSSTGDPFEYIKTTAQGAAEFNDVPAKDATILWHNLPATLAPGESRLAAIIVRNTGDASWSAAANYRLAQDDSDTAFVSGKRVLLNDSLDEIPLYGGIYRGRPKVFQVALTAPVTPGIYRTHWRMVQEGVGRFGEELKVAIEVKEKAAASVSLSSLSQIADGTTRPVEAATTPPGLSVSLTYNGSPYPPTSAGNYIVVATIDDASYYGSITNRLVIVPNPNILAGNGGFESEPLGTALSTPPDAVDAATFTGWRAFNVSSASVSFDATIIGHASAGNRAIRLDVTSTSRTAGYALDQWGPSMHTPIQQGTTYLASFDAAWIAGLATNNLLFQVQEFDVAVAFLGNGISQVRSVSATNYQAQTFVYRPVDPAAAGVGFFFGPLRGMTGQTAISLDNVRLMVAPRLVNGDFESSPLTSAGGAGPFADSTTILGWRLFSVGSPPIHNLTATIVDARAYNGGEFGSRAIRLNVENTGAPAGHDYGFDNANALAPVTTGRKYTLSFDARLDGVVGGSLALSATIAEFTGSGTFTGTQQGFTPKLPMDQTFHRYSTEYTVTNPATTHVLIAFRPVTTGSGVVVLDNVGLDPAVENSPTNIAISLTGNLLNLSWPASHLGWRLQSNSVNPADALYWFDVPDSGEMTRLISTIDSLAPSVFFRLRHPTAE